MNYIKFMTRTAATITIGSLIATGVIAAITLTQIGRVVPKEEFVSTEYITEATDIKITKEKDGVKIEYNIPTILKKPAVAGRDALTRGEEVIEEAIEATPERLEEDVRERVGFQSSAEYNLCRAEERTNDECHEEVNEKANAEIAKEEKLEADRREALQAQEAIVDYFTIEFDKEKLNIK